jgi:two-component system chemotaxis response regulator CheY
MGYALDKLRVLIVDQNAHIRELLRTILQSVGTGSIDLSYDADDGFDAYCRREYDVVFTDSELAPISGLEFVNLIRTSAKSPNPYVPIIMLSSFSDQERIRLARDHGVTEFLAKPFTVDIVLKRLEAVIENPRSFVRTGSYFGPDRRRSSILDYSGPDRRKSELREVSLSKKDISDQQRAALVGNKRAIDGLLRD